MKNINAAEIFKAISSIETFDPFCMKKRVTIADIRKQLLSDITKARNWSKEKIFCKLVDDLPPKKWTQRRVGSSITAGS